MRNYVFKLFVDDQIMNEVHGYGNNAIEAFEQNVENGSIYFPDGQEIEVLALNNQGLGIRFKAIKGF